MGSALLWPVKEAPVIITTPRSSRQDLIRSQVLKKNPKTLFSVWFWMFLPSKLVFTLIWLLLLPQRQTEVSD